MILFFDSVDDADNLLEMNDSSVVEMRPMHSSYLLCSCNYTLNGGDPINEAVCSKEKNIICDVFPTKSYQKNTCHAKRRRRSLQERLTYIPNNFVEHEDRKKAILEFLKILRIIHLIIKNNIRNEIYLD